MWQMISNQSTAIEMMVIAFPDGSNEDQPNDNADNEDALNMKVMEIKKPKLLDTDEGDMEEDVAETSNNNNSNVEEFVDIFCDGSEVTDQDNSDEVFSTEIDPGMVREFGEMVERLKILGCYMFFS